MKYNNYLPSCEVDDGLCYGDGDRAFEMLQENYSCMILVVSDVMQYCCMKMYGLLFLPVQYREGVGCKEAGGRLKVSVKILKPLSQSLSSEHKTLGAPFSEYCCICWSSARQREISLLLPVNACEEGFSTGVLCPSLPESE